MFRLRSISVLSSARIFAIVQGAIGIVVGFIFLIFAVVGAAIVPAQQKLGTAGLIVAAVLMPVIYGVLGFVMGALWAFVYNMAAQAVGGLELQLDAVPSRSFAPPSVVASPPPAGGY